MSLPGLRYLSRLAAGAAIKSSESACMVSSFASLASSSTSSSSSGSSSSCNVDHRGCTSDARACFPPSPLWDSDRDQAFSPARFGQHVQRRPSVASMRGILQLRSPPHWHQQFCTSASTRQAEPSSGSGQSKEGSAAGSSSTGTADDPAKEKQPPLSQDVYYEGPLSKTHKMLKLVSISNTVIACAAAPLIVMYADISYVSRVGLASSLVIFGLLTTGALHWITNPYVHELKFNAASQQIDVRTVTLLGGHRWHSFHLSDVKPLPWDRPVATFMAKDRFYYIDVYSFPDEELLKRLTPDEATVPKGYKDDEDD